MTAQGQLNQRIRTSLDRLAWAFGDLQRYLVERGVWPARSLGLLSTTGERWLVTGTRLQSCKRTGKPSGLLIPEEECLWGVAQLPDMPRNALGAAVDEALWRASPWPRDQIVSAWRGFPDVQGGWMVEWGVCRRSRCDDWRTAQGLNSDALLFLGRKNLALVVRDKSWSNRQRHHGLIHGLLLVMAIFAVSAVAAPAVMPLVLEREAVRKAVRHIAAQEPLSVPIRANLDALRLNADLANELYANMVVDLPLASVIEALSQTLPDDTWLDRVDINGREIKLSGMTANATDLLALLARHPSLSEVRASVASVRDSTLNKERFTFEMRWRNEEVKP